MSESNIYFLTMKISVNTLPEIILARAESLPEGSVLSPKEFLHLGSRPAIDQALSRLTKAGKLLRVARGIYIAPISSRFGTRTPAPEKVVKAMAEQSGDIVAPHGACAASRSLRPAMTGAAPIAAMLANALRLVKSRVRLVTLMPRVVTTLPKGPTGLLLA